MHFEPIELFHIIFDFLAQFKYILLAIGSFIEGPILMISSGIALHEGVFSLVPMIIAFVVGDIFGDILWYLLGRYGLDSTVKRICKFFKISDHAFQVLQSLFHRHKEVILFCSKITLGLGVGIGVMLVAGYSRIPFGRFLFINVVGGLVMVGSLVALGYYFGDVILHAASTNAFIVGLVVLILVVLLVFWVVRYIRRQITKEIALD